MSRVDPGDRVVEVDGDSHFPLEGLAYDAARDDYLAGLGLEVLHVTNADVQEALEAVVQAIWDTVRAALPAPDGEQCWRCADTLRPGEFLFGGPTLAAVELVGVERAATVETVHDLTVNSPPAFATETCCLHCGQGRRRSTCLTNG